MRSRFVLCALAIVAPACSSPTYVLRQAAGQLSVLTKRVKITEVLKRPTLSTDHRQKLQLVLLARKFAHGQIGLRLTGAYTYYYDTKGRPVAYNLSAAPKDSLRPRLWTFPIVGSLPYIGFFDRAQGLKRRKDLDAEGLDTHYRPVPAYSSLGWFDDPVYSSMLDADPWRLVEVVIHETTHTTLFLRNRVAFNESLAVFVGQQGALNMAAQLLGRHSETVKKLQQKIGRRRRFGRLVSRLYRRLKRLYAQPLSREKKLAQREVHFAWARSRYKKIFVDPKTWGSFVRRPLNNAILLSYGRYNQGLRFHRRAYHALGNDLARLVRLYRHAQHFGDPIAYVGWRLNISLPRGQRM